MLDYGLQGALLGLYAGISPGPLLTLVISETLARGFRAGLMVALAPVFSDTLIIGAIVLVLSRIPGTDTVLGILGLAGGALLAHMGITGMLTRTVEVRPEADAPGSSLKRGILVNLLNPNPYLFWLAIGVPLVLRAWEQGPGEAGVFVAGFYALLVGSKSVLACGVGRYRSLLRGRAYILVIRGLGLTLVGFAVYLFRDALERVGFL